MLFVYTLYFNGHICVKNAIFIKYYKFSKTGNNSWVGDDRARDLNSVHDAL